ncbi:MAG: hypothetical protein A2Y40_10940 [Candidatus Margulisbacteria bacterium GWF2_35_9]|nr:MAG: hypothetical protein A2Y40_10940 [Candidatus Margulisbacteria bacterium GWF2_35_9]
MEHSSEFIELFKKGDHKAFEHIYDTTKKLTYNVIYKMTMDIEESNDIMHDVYVKIYENKHKYQQIVDLKYWIYRIAVNHTLNVLKKRSIFNKQRSSIGFFYTKQINNQKNDYEEGPIMALLLKIKPKYKLPIILKDIENLSYEEISKVLKINIGTVRSRLNRGRKQLLESYQKEVANE